MLRICFVTEDRERFSDLIVAFSARPDVEFVWSATLAEALPIAERHPPDLMIIDEFVDGLSALAIARRVIRKNAMVNLVVVSPLKPDAFHEAAEGLGIVACLPLNPLSERRKILLKTLALHD